MWNLRLCLVLMLTWLNFGSTTSAQEIQRGKLKSLDVEKKKLVVTVEKRDLEFTLTDDTRVLGSSGKTLVERFKEIKVGQEIFFRPITRNGREVLEAVKPVDGDRDGRQNPPGQRVSPEHASLKPINELADGKYQDFVGGFYPKGKNSRPQDHEAAGLKLASQIRPLNAEGKPDDSGKVVLLSLGMSNTSQSSQGFQSALREARELAPSFQFVNGAQGGMTAEAIQDPNDNRTGARFWSEVDSRLKQAGVTRSQVQAVWIKQADAGPRQGFPDYALKLQKELVRIVQVVHDRFPNTKLAYLSSRTYGGFATTSLNPEPYAYESGFAVKWLIEQQLDGDESLNFDPAKGAVKAPWLSWGPYLWANGSTKREDGFSYEPSDFVGDGTHQSPAGQRKVGELLLKFFQTDTTTKPWFVRSSKNTD